MVEDRLTDGRRVAELLASDLTGRADPPFDRIRVTDPDRDVTPTTDGARAYDVTLHPVGEGGHGDDAGETAAVVGAGRRLARTFVHPERARLEVSAGLAAAREAVTEGDPPLRARPVGGGAPRLVVFLPDGVAVKRVQPVLAAAAGAATGTDTDTETGGAGDGDAGV